MNRLIRFTISACLLLGHAGFVSAQMIPGGDPGGYPMTGEMPQGAPGEEGSWIPQFGYDWTCRPGLHGAFGGVDYLGWWNKGRHMPALSATSTAGTLRPDAAILGLGSTTVLYGEQNYGADYQSGGRVTFGLHLDPNRNIGVMSRTVMLQGDTTRETRAGNGTPIYGLPFFNVQTNLEDARLVSFPGELTGNLDIKAENDFLSTEVLGKFRMTEQVQDGVSLLAGYHFIRMDDDLLIRSAGTITDPGNVLVGLRIDSRDLFRCENEFHGAALGVTGERTRGRIRVSWLGKVSYGGMRQDVAVAGSRVNTIGGGSVTSAGGLYAQPSNIGTYSRSVSAFVPEFATNLHLQATERIDFSLGYTLLYLNNVVLSGDQIDRRVNLQQPVGPNLPAFAFRDTDFWYMGLNFGVNVNF